MERMAESGDNLMERMKSASVPEVNKQGKELHIPPRWRVFDATKGLQ